MAIKQIKIGNTIHDIQTTISNVEGLQAALDDKDIFWIEATPIGESANGIQPVTINKSFSELLEAFVNGKYICCKINESENAAIILPCAGASNEIAVFGMSMDGLAAVLIVTPYGEAAFQQVELVTDERFMAHLNDTYNPHSVTASQVGAYTKSEVDTKISNIQLTPGPQGPAGTTPTIKAAAGSNIGSVGTPSVTASTSGTTTTFTFNNLKGAKGDKGDPGTNATTTATATTSANGLMSAADKTKLNGIAEGANNYTLPTASSTLGGVKTTSTVTSTSGLTACPIISGVPYYKDTDTTYSLSSFGITATAAELNYTDGVTSNIQTQLNGKQASITGAATTITGSNLTASRALVSNSAGKIAVSAVTSTELGYLDGVTSNIQTQLNEKAGKKVDGTVYTIDGVEVTAKSGAEIFNAYSENKASGAMSHAEGRQTIASGDYSHAEGWNTTASKLSAHAEGRQTTASGDYSHAEGYGVIASGSGSHAEGGTITEAGYYGNFTRTIDDITITGTTASGHASHAEGYLTFAQGYISHAEGHSTTASGRYSHAEGYNTIASNNASHSEGSNTTASGTYSHTEGYGVTASGDSSHAEGSNTTASGIFSHAEGDNTSAQARASHAEGRNTIAKRGYSHAEGYGTIASQQSQHVQGEYNIEDTSNTYAHIVGNGDSDTARSNAHTLDWNGNAWFAGDVTDGIGNSLSGLKTQLDGKANASVATQSANGLMSSADKTVFDTADLDALTEADATALLTSIYSNN